MIETGITAAAKALFLKTVVNDSCKIALYGPDAKLGLGTRCYTPDGEVSGLGYTAGGQKLTDCAVVEDDDDGSVYLTWCDVEWPRASVSASGYMIYNTSRNNTALFVGSWGAEYTSTNGPFRVPIPDKQILLL